MSTWSEKDLVDLFDRMDGKLQEHQVMRDAQKAGFEGVISNMEVNLKKLEERIDDQLKRHEEEIRNLGEEIKKTEEEVKQLREAPPSTGRVMVVVGKEEKDPKGSAAFHHKKNLSDSLEYFS